jgi:hypothetical protein
MLLCVSALGSQKSTPWSSAQNPEPCPETPKSLLGSDLAEFSGRPAEILNLNPLRLTARNIKQNYVKLARVYHPDKYTSKGKRKQAHKVFLQLVDARDTLLAKLERERNLPRYETIPFHWM